MELHPQLRQDTHRLGRLPFCDILLHQNGIVPWVILVPDTSETDLLGLPEEQRNQALAETALAGEILRRIPGITKLNFAAIGNVVPQLHLHVIGRHPGDHCWPKPVWGNLTEQRQYAADDIASFRQQFHAGAELRGWLLRD